MTALDSIAVDDLHDGVHDADPSAAFGIDAALIAFRDLTAQNAHISTLVASTLGIGGTDVRALLFIAEAPSPTPKQVAEFLELSTGAITGLVDRIVAAGLVRREPHPNDRRSLVLELAPDGETAVGRIADFYRRAFGAAITADQAPLLADAFTAIAKSLASTAARDIAEAEAR